MIRKKKTYSNRVLTTIKRSNKVLHALDLPKVSNLNPRSIYNKVDAFCTYVEEEDIDLVFLSERHERWYPTKRGDDQTLNELISLEDHIVISNPHLRNGK